ncbi:MAG TPA: integration host factor subunit beta [Phaeodactylibacter sp.]|nr:integration host factor subunit beta [Phaeodactylibacter sp.]
MRKADLATAISEESGIPKADVLVTLELFFKEVKKTLSEGENVYIRGFGSFVVKERAAKTGRNIKDGTPVKIPACHVPHFKPAAAFKEQVKKGMKKNSGKGQKKRKRT